MYQIVHDLASLTEQPDYDYGPATQFTLRPQKGSSSAQKGSSSGGGAGKLRPVAA